MLLGDRHQIACVIWASKHEYWSFHNAYHSPCLFLKAEITRGDRSRFCSAIGYIHQSPPLRQAHIDI